MRTTILRQMLGCACALGALAVPGVAFAQDSTDEGDDASSEQGPQQRSARQQTRISPYIEASQVLIKNLEPGDDLVTYTTVAAGVDASVAGRNSAASVSLRYERRIGWDDDTLDGDTISGVARASIALVPRAVTIEAGALAAQTRVEGTGAASIGGFAGNDDSTSQIYAGYIGPSVRTSAGDVEIEGHYRFGYTRVGAPDVVLGGPGSTPVDLFDESTTHSASARAGVRPNTVVPIGVGIGGGWNEQNVSNLDQRIRDRYVRADVTVPLSPNLALVGGVGYEDVEVSSRDAVRDTLGNPVVGPDGRYITDENSPRLIAYETDGLIWDAGVLWRPSRRTSFEAHVGRRYGSMTYYGNFAYAPNSSTSINVAVYDSVTSFGGQLVNTLATLPAQFAAFRNPITGQIGGCVASLQGGSCFNGALGGLSSAVFRSRGIASGISVDLGRTQLGVGAGYDRRSFLANPGSALGLANGVVDESLWYALYGTTQLDQRSSLTANANVAWYESGANLAADVLGYSASLAYNRSIWRGLSATAAVGLDGIERENLIDFMSASGLLGLRYTFN